MIGYIYVGNVERFLMTEIIQDTDNEHDFRIATNDTILVFRNENKEILRIGADGELVIGPGLTQNEAAREFAKILYDEWQKLEKPCTQ